MLTTDKFRQSARVAINDSQLQTAIQRATSRANEGRETMMDETTNRAALRQQARDARLRGLRDLPELLEQAEAAIQAMGGKVLWALDTAEANKHVLNICRQHKLKRGVKSKSMVTEEIQLLSALKTAGIEMIETDLGEFIVQVSGDHPSHITMPVMHLTKERIRDVLMEKDGMPYAETAEDITAYARQRLRQAYLEADFGVTGGNFIIAETGHVITVTNEGNGRLTTTIPPVHIAIVGIEKIIPTWADFITLVQLLTRSATGQRLSVYVNAINAPSPAIDGAQHFYLILLDNGRSDIYASEYVESLACIRCGACLNTCPVYQSIGGHVYDSVYPGPIGSIITPLLYGKKNASPLPFASSLCGACKSACPVDINIPDMLLRLRQDLQAEQGNLWRIGMAGFGFGIRHPLLYRTGVALAKRLTSKNTLPRPFQGWTDERDFPGFAQQTFRDWWQKHHK
ncbi:MAG: iron-sulfur cluster-binding protein [Chloroflexi bacterium]|nr:MAG: iron-sulfur cluster-binding protein [Chloroflexota bacterium]